MAVKKTLSSSMIKTLVMSLIGVMVVIGISLYFVNRYSVVKRVNAQSEQIGNRLAFGLILPVWDMNNMQIEALLRLEMEADMLSGIVIKDAKGSLIYTAFRGEKGKVELDTKKESEAKAFGKKKLVIEKKIIKDKETLGIVTIYVTDKEIKQAMTTVLVMTLIQIILLTLCITIVVYFSIKKQVITPLQQVLSILQDIERGKGDLTRRITIFSENEFGELARLFNSFVDNIQTIMTEVIGNANTLSKSSQSLLDTSDVFAKSANSINEQSATVLKAANLSSSNVDSIAASTEEMSTGIQSVATAIEEISVSINEVAKSCQKESAIATQANTQAIETQDIMERLGASAIEVGKVVDVIKNIANRTNLLALNATIEAASAGAAGRGFAVVAHEVKELAKKTSEATHEISKQINDMQMSASNSISVIKAIAKTIEDINDISHTIVSAVEEQSATVNEVSQNVSRVSSSASEVAKNVSQSAVGLTDVASGINTVSNDVKATITNVQAIKDSSFALSRLSTDLHKLVGQFKI